VIAGASNDDDDDDGKHHEPEALLARHPWRLRHSRIHERSDRPVSHGYVRIPMIWPAQDFYAALSIGTPVIVR
jgi:hypothetical protein